MSFDESTQDPNIGRDDLTIRNAGLGEIGDGLAAIGVVGPGKGVLACLRRSSRLHISDSKPRPLAPPHFFHYERAAASAVDTIQVRRRPSARSGEQISRPNYEDGVLRRGRYRLAASLDPNRPPNCFWRSLCFGRLSARLWSGTGWATMAVLRPKNTSGAGFWRGSSRKSSRCHSAQSRTRASATPSTAGTAT
jgi:hypothetical protein